jgi:acylglycerol lipase
MTATIRSLVTSDGVKLRVRQYAAVEGIRGVVICLHGIQSHSGWYQYSSQQLAAAGFEVYFTDRRGSGLNGRQRGHADHGQRLLHDVRQLARLVRQQHPGESITLLGVSWGGKIAAAFAATFPELIDRLALLYPGLEPKIRPNWWQKLQLSFARSHDIRHQNVLLPLNDPKLFTDVAEHQRFIDDDPLALHAVTSGFLNAGRDLDKILRAQAANICQPTLLMLAGKDRIINNAQTKRRVETFASQHVTTIEYPHAEHTLEFDSKRDVMVRDLVTWLNWQ